MRALSLVSLLVVGLVASTLAQCPSANCPSGATCCELIDGSPGCCPFENAECCTDGFHCCPQGFSCDVASGQCNKNAGILGLADAKSVKPMATIQAAPSCPAGTCPSGDTCCELDGGSFGCCPYPNADCCSDHEHCCPNGYTCDLGTGQCTKSTSLNGVTKDLVAIKPIPADSCPAGTCPSGNTCCQLSDGSYGCCPYPNADCCSDHDHCCPNGYTCDLSTGQCTKSASLTGVIVTKDLVAIKPALAATCPAGTCPSGDTCCQLSDGSYGCCPYPNADCCTDHDHCCPNGYNCDLKTGQCTKGASLTGVIVTKNLVALKPAASAAPTCPAGTCPTDDTCCQLGDGSFGCCPYPNADCCTDHEHCCPNGYSCDIKTGQCTKGQTLTLVKVKMAALKKPEDM